MLSSSFRVAILLERSEVERPAVDFASAVACLRQVAVAAAGWLLVGSSTFRSPAPRGTIFINCPLQAETAHDPEEKIRKTIPLSHLRHVGPPRGRGLPFLLGPLPQDRPGQVGDGCLQDQLADPRSGGS